MSPHRNALRNMLPLLIGEGAAPDGEMSRFLASAVTPICPEAAVGADVDGFSMTLGATHFSCFRASPSRINFDDAPALRLVFPYQGHIRVKTDRAADDLFSGVDVGLFRTAVSEIIAVEHSSFICVEIDRQRLHNVALICPGVDGREFFVRLERALYARGVEFVDCSIGFAALRHYFSNLNYYVSNRRLGLSLGLEELFYRHVVLLVFESNQFGKRLRGLENREKLAALENVIRASPSKRFSLAEMSANADMSSRALQKLVMSTFGVTPIEWQIGLRLDEARARLRRSEGRISLTTLAEELGFSTPSRFTEQYRRKFGVTPSEDLLQMRNSDAPNDNGEDKVRNMDRP